MNNKKLVIAIVALVAVIGIMLGVWQATRPEIQQGSKAITVVVVHKDGTQKTFEYRTDAEYLAEVLLAENLVTGYESQYGLTIESVDGEVADWTADSAYWAIYIGDDYATTGISEIVVLDGAVYKFEYTKFVG